MLLFWDAWAKLNYALLNSASYYNEKSVSYSSLIIECITIVSRGGIILQALVDAACPSERGANPKKKVHFHKYDQLFMHDCNRASAAEMSTISWLERSIILSCRHSRVVNTARCSADIAESIYDNPKTAFPQVIKLRGSRKEIVIFRSSFLIRLVTLN